MSKEFFVDPSIQSISHQFTGVCFNLKRGHSVNKNVKVYKDEKGYYFMWDNFKPEYLNEQESETARRLERSGNALKNLLQGGVKL